MALRRWEHLGAVSPTALTEGRLLLHHAAQLVAAAGRSLAPPRPDDGHTTLRWRADARDLVGQEVPGPRPWRAALRPDSLSLAVLANDGEVGRLDLAGLTRAAALAWLADSARRLDADGRTLSLAAPYALPAHPIDSGAPFAPPSDGSLAELVRWVADGDALLGSVAATWTGAAPVRLWPHHFDLGSVLPLEAGSAGDARSIGIGFSLGDEGIAEPYLYATPWPPPPADSLPPLPAAGRWHHGGWTGALLTGTEIVAAGDGDAQASLAREFLERTTEVLRAR